MVGAEDDGTWYEVSHDGVSWVRVDRGHYLLSEHPSKRMRQPSEHAPPGAANAVRRVVRKVTEVRGVFTRIDYSGTFIDPGARTSSVALDPGAVAIDEALVPTEAVSGRNGPRGTFRVTVEFEPDSEE